MIVSDTITILGPSPNLQAFDRVFKNSQGQENKIRDERDIAKYLIKLKKDYLVFLSNIWK